MLRNFMKGRRRDERILNDMNETLKNILITLISLVFIFVIVIFLIWINLDYWQLLLIGLTILFVAYLINKILVKYYPNSKYCKFSKNVLEYIKHALSVL